MFLGRQDVQGLDDIREGHLVPEISVPPLYIVDFRIFKFKSHVFKRIKQIM